MATYQIHRLKSHLRQQFRFAPHVSGVSNVKLRDYEVGGTVEAASPYAAFFALRECPTSLELVSHAHPSKAPSGDSDPPGEPRDEQQPRADERWRSIMKYALE